MLVMLSGKWARKQIQDSNNIRTIFIERLRNINKKHRHVFGDLVICCDDKKYWRRNYFPLYKHNRKAIRESSDLDWPKIIEMMDKFREELKEYFPYKVLLAEWAEADDIIAYMIKNYQNETNLIFSGDSDFCQLHRFPNVKQYSAQQQKFITVDDPYLILKEKIIKGDRSDGVPNILSDDNVFLTGNRQNSIASVKLKSWLNQPAKSFCINETMKRNWDRNQKLIDLNFIPDDIINTIREQDQFEKNIRKDKLIEYFMKYDQTQFIQYLQDF